MLELKKQIAEVFHVNLDNIILRKNNQQGEIKGLGQRIAELHISDGDLIKVELGTPHEEDAFEINGYVVELIR